MEDQRPHKPEENRRPPVLKFDDLDEYEQDVRAFRSCVGARDIPIPRRLSTPYKIMAVGTESFLHLARPLAPAVIGVQPTTAPLNVIIQPQVRISPRTRRAVH
jgi:hypothetical protein